MIIKNIFTLILFFSTTMAAYADFSDCPFAHTFTINGPPGVKVLSVTPLTIASSLLLPSPNEKSPNYERLQSNPLVTSSYTDRQITISQSECSLPRDPLLSLSPIYPNYIFIKYLLQHRDRLFTVEIGYDKNRYCEIKIIDGSYSIQASISATTCSPSITYNFSKISSSSYSFDF